MAHIPVAIENKITKYLNALRINNIPVSRAFLFGSYARGTYSKWSDIEPVPFSPMDFNDNDPFAHEILSTGIQLA